MCKKKKITRNFLFSYFYTYSYILVKYIFWIICGNYVEYYAHKHSLIIKIQSGVWYTSMWLHTFKYFCYYILTISTYITPIMVNREATIVSLFTRDFRTSVLIVLGPLHVVWQVSFGCWITWSISSWERNNCLQSWVNSQNNNLWPFRVKIVVIL